MAPLASAARNGLAAFVPPPSAGLRAAGPGRRVWSVLPAAMAVSRRYGDPGQPRPCS
ncbi:MAG: hypothetical protein Q8R91_07970 [Candidatus Omnitrophota bacterium]|nr:hypothetical protein [Candidatus Omnitrophota bacterium]